MIVIDVGCATYGGDSSIPYLIDEFKPYVLYGFDPASEPQAFRLNDTGVIILPGAAWIYDGRVGFQVSGLSGRVDVEAPSVPCYDLAKFILSVASSEDEIVLKMDAEGAEYVLLPHLVEHDADLQLKLAWVERHCLTCGRGGGGHREGCVDNTSFPRYEEIVASMRCEMHEWNR